MKLLIIIAAGLAALILRAQPVELVLQIAAIPPDTPAGSNLFLAGSVNNWNPQDPAYKLTKTNDVYQIRLKLKTGDRIEYKFTRGNWETVEKGENGEEIANRTYHCREKSDTLSLVIHNWRDLVEEGNQNESTLSGNVIIRQDFYLPALKRYRTIRIYLPPEYYTTDNRYPVLYMHDGQNLFDKTTSFAGEWQIDETLERLYYQEKLRGMIAVGIDNHPTKRLDEYSPWQNLQHQAGGEGAAYVEFLVNKLKPWIDENYRTRPQAQYTTIAGSSMGGLISLYAGSAIRMFSRNWESFLRLSGLPKNS